MLSRALAGGRVTLRLDEHLLHAISDDRVVKTMPLPIPAGRLPRLQGVRAETTPLPPGSPERTAPKLARGSPVRPLTRDKTA